jgi:hypothetical protein
MRRAGITAFAAIVAAAVPAAGAEARVALEGGSTTLKLAHATAAALSANGITVTPLQPAGPRGRRIAFPITGGTIDAATGAGRVNHSGGLALRAGGTRVALRSFRVRVGARRSVLTARAGEARIPVLSLSLDDARVTRPGLGTTVRNVNASLTGRAARALNAAFSTRLFARGLPIGKVAVRAVPAEVELRRGATTLALDPAAGQALASLGISAAPIDPASAPNDGLRFPITGGKLDAETFAGRVRHSGGIRLTRDATVVDLERFTIRVDDDPDLTALVGGSRVSILSLDLTQLDAQVDGRRMTLAGARASLTAAAASALNQAFATDAFTEGLLLGTATVSARAR